MQRNNITKKRHKEERIGEEKKGRGKEERGLWKNERMRGYPVTPLTSLTAWPNGTTWLVHLPSLGSALLSSVPLFWDSPLFLLCTLLFLNLMGSQREPNRSHNIFLFYFFFFFYFLFFSCCFQYSFVGYNLLKLYTCYALKLIIKYLSYFVVFYTPKIAKIKKCWNGCWKID